MPEAKPKQPSIVEALVAAAGAMGAVGKHQRNEDQGYSFRGIDDVVNAASPALRAQGILVYPQVQSVNYQPITTARGAMMTEAQVVVDYIFTGPAGDYVTVTTPGEARDSGDKAVPKAMSVALRIALLQALMLPTDEPDPDLQQNEGGFSAPANPSQDALIAAQETVGANFVSGGHGEWDLNKAAALWDLWGQVPVKIHEADTNQLLAFAKWLVTDGHRDKITSKQEDTP